MANTPALVRAPPSARAGASPLALPVCAPAPPLAPLPAPPRHPLRPPPLALARRECRRNPWIPVGTRYIHSGWHSLTQSAST